MEESTPSFYVSAASNPPLTKRCDLPARSRTQGAQQHHAPSMMYLGKMFLYGQGFPVDYDMALLWFEKAAEEVRTAPTQLRAI